MLYSTYGKTAHGEIEEVYMFIRFRFGPPPPSNPPSSSLRGWRCCRHKCRRRSWGGGGPGNPAAAPPGPQSGPAGVWSALHSPHSRLSLHIAPLGMW